MRRLALSLLAAGFLVACNRTPTAPTGVPLSASRSDHGSASALVWSPTTTTNPDTYDFGTVDASTTSSQVFTLTDAGGKSAGTVEISLTGSSAFTITVDNCSGNGVNATHGCTVTVQYAPTASGQTDQATLTANGEHASASLALTGASAATSYIYWVDGYDLSIGRANLDGTGINNQFIPGSFSSVPYDVAVYGTHVYWSASNKTIYRANLDGTGKTALITGLSYPPRGIAVDGTHIYWVSHTLSLTGTIGRANLDGSGVNQNFIGSSSAPLQDPDFIAVDGTHIYWTSLLTFSGTIGRANLDGTGVNTGIITSLESPTGIAVDGTYLYWASQATGDVGRATLTSTGATGATSTFITGGDYTEGVAVYGTHLYWANLLSSPGTIGRASLSGAGHVQNWIQVTRPQGLAVGPQ